MTRRKKWNYLNFIAGSLLFLFLLRTILYWKRLPGWPLPHSNTALERRSVIRELSQPSKEYKDCSIPHLKHKLTDAEFSGVAVSCQRLKPVKDSCQIASKIFHQGKTNGFHQGKINGCQSDEGDKIEICKVKKLEHSYSVSCNTTACEKEVMLGTLDTETGSYIWKKVRKKHALETAIMDIMRKPNSGFCLIKCQTASTDYIDYGDGESEQYLYMNYAGYASPQILNIPLYVASEMKSNVELTKKYINFNVIFLDSVSRHHFFRSLPKTVQLFERMLGNQSQSNHKTPLVLDFELMQGIRSRTYESLQALFSGLVNPFEKPFSTLAMPPTPLKTEVILKPLKELGYGTLWLEDLCYLWEWGISKDLLVHDKELTQEQTWKNLQKALRKAGIDSLGNTYTHCDILRNNEVNDHFHGPDRVCYNSKHQHEYSLEYLRMYQENMHSQGQPYFSFYETNVGHEDTGVRIQDFDEDFVKYLKFIKSQHNTLTVIFSDHGNAYGKFMEKSKEARIELFHPFLFMILPKEIQNVLHASNLKSLIVNQKRLISLLDLHYTLTDFISLLHKRRHSGKKHLQTFPVSDFNKQFNVTSEGLLSVVSEYRTCSQMPRINPNLCICEGHEMSMAYSPYYFILGLYAIGELNNHIQDQRRHGSKEKAGGFGNCHRLVLHRVENIRESRSQDDRKTVKMDLHVPSTTSNKTEVFFVTIETPVHHYKNDKQVQLTKFERVTSYSQYGKCADSGVEVQLCVCDIGQRRQSVSQSVPHTYNDTTVQKSEIDIDGHKCLNVVAQSNDKGVVFELYGSCKQRVSLEFILDTTNLILSSGNRVTVEIFPHDIVFLTSGVVENEKKDWSWSAETAYKIV